MKKENIRKLWFFDNQTGQPTYHKTSDYNGVSAYDEETGEVIPNYGPWLNNHYGQRFYDSKRNLLKSRCQVILMLLMEIMENLQ